MRAEHIPLLASHFRALAEPARLRLLAALRAGEMAVSELVTATGLGQANASKHLNKLYETGFVTRRKEGLFVYYALNDRDIMKLCELMSGRIETNGTRRRKKLGD